MENKKNALKLQKEAFKRCCKVIYEKLNKSLFILLVEIFNLSIKF